ncbi:BPSS1780 family membrane protein [Xenorhabdus sp. Sc-CR9]|uniref:BPSS1780 family membrane protein n=1 Tax=Xenorhabdus sp. Sc-CR9 TaxID=2584468 RepID=UPI001F2D9CEE|nr:BPSS1780 family membrane protein [Xenorhabdus sp. Sc-CR9]
MDAQSIKPNSEKSSNDSDNDIFIPDGQKIKVSTAIGSIGDAWDFISPKLGMWVLMGIIYSTINFGIMLIPYLGFILSSLLDPLFIAGIISICENQRITDKFELKRLFYGFRHKCGSLFLIGIVVCGIKSLGYISAALIDGDDLFQVVFDDMYSISLYRNYDSTISVDESSLSFLSLFSIIIALFLSTAYSWFAPTLIMLNNFSVKKALSTSLNSICKNLLGALLFFFFINLLIFVSSLPLLLGLLFTTPLRMASHYSSYRNVFYLHEIKKDEMVMKN